MKTLERRCFATYQKQDLSGWLFRKTIRRDRCLGYKQNSKRL